MNLKEARDAYILAIQRSGNAAICLDDPERMGRRLGSAAWKRFRALERAGENERDVDTLLALVAEMNEQLALVEQIP